MSLNQQCFGKSGKKWWDYVALAEVSSHTFSTFLFIWRLTMIFVFFSSKDNFLKGFRWPLNTLKKFQKWCKTKKKKKERIPQTFRPRLDLVSKLKSRPSFERNLPCERWAYRVGCVCGYVCLSHTLPVIYSPSNTLPFCLLVNCHGEGGYNGRLQGTINLDTSYLCLRLQGGSLSSCKHD